MGTHGDHLPLAPSAARPPGVETRLSLLELVTRYSVARDDRDMASLLDCFTPDAVFRRRGKDVVGHRQLHDFFLASMRRYDLTTHTNHGQILHQVGAGLVKGLVTGHAELVLDGRLVVASYRYHDTYRRTDTGWRIASRELRFLYAMPVDRLAQGFTGMRRVCWPGAEDAAADYPETLPTWGYPDQPTLVGTAEE